MPHSIGQALPLSRFWQMLCDTLSLGRPSSPMRIQRRFLLADVAAARAIASPCPSWRAVLIKACAHVSAATPLLRRCAFSCPWPRIYEHSETIAVVSVERDDGIDFVKLRRPELLRLAEIDKALVSPTPSSSSGGLAVRVGGACSGRFRARRFGTVSVTTASLRPLSTLTPTLYHGPISANGEVDVCLTYDHRLMDGIEAARIMTALEDSLHERILTELRYLESVEAAA